MQRTTEKKKTATAAKKKKKKEPKDTTCRVCAQCKKISPRKSSFTCGDCLTVFYCGRQCQREHWINGHRSECVKSTGATVKTTRLSHRFGSIMETATGSSLVKAACIVDGRNHFFAELSLFEESCFDELTKDTLVKALEKHLTTGDGRKPCVIVSTKKPGTVIAAMTLQPMGYDEWDAKFRENCPNRDHLDDYFVSTKNEPKNDQNFYGVIFTKIYAGNPLRENNLQTTTATAHIIRVLMGS